MNYAIEELEKQVWLCDYEPLLEKDKKELLKGIEILKNKSGESAPKEVIHFLIDLYYRIEESLSKWGNDYLEAKKRVKQEKGFNTRLFTQMLSTPDPTLLCC